LLPRSAQSPVMLYDPDHPKTSKFGKNGHKSEQMTRKLSVFAIFSASSVPDLSIKGE